MLQITAKSSCANISQKCNHNLGVSTTHSSGGAAASQAMNADVEEQKWGRGARLCPRWYHLELL